MHRGVFCQIYYYGSNKSSVFTIVIWHKKWKISPLCSDKTLLCSILGKWYPWFLRPKEARLIYNWTSYYYNIYSNIYSGHCCTSLCARGPFRPKYELNQTMSYFIQKTLDSWNSYHANRAILELNTFSLIFLFQANNRGFGWHHWRNWWRRLRYHGLWRVLSDDDELN